MKNPTKNKKPVKKVLKKEKSIKIEQNNDVIFKLPPYKVENVIASLSQVIGWGVKQCNIPATWSETQGEDITIAVIDSGFTDHTDIGDNCIKGVCTVSNQENIDDVGHSTHCIGIICAKNNEEGMVGISSKAKVIAIKALGSEGTGDYLSITKAVEAAIELSPDIISMSLGGSYDFPPLHDAIKKAVSLNIPVVVAAGNEGTKGMGYPALYPECFTIAAFNEFGKIADFSSRGDKIDWGAPGVDIYSTYLNNQYCKMSGTSMATPWVTGIIALLLAKHRKQEKEIGQNDCKTVEEIKQHLLKYTINQTGIIGRDKAWGYGLIAVDKMILATNDGNLNLPISPDIKYGTATKCFRTFMFWLTHNYKWKY